MIIKFKTRKNIYTAKQLVRYILTDKGRIKDPFDSFVLLQNIPTLDPSLMHRAFITNDRYRQQRQGGTTLYHEQLSIHPKDKAVVTDEMLKDLLLKYIELRGAQQALVIGKAHTHGPHPHLHVMISATEAKSSQSLRMSRAEFDELRRAFEVYQVEKYPQLSHSIRYLDKPKKPREFLTEDRNGRKEREFQIIKRCGVRSLRKTKLREALERVFSGCKTIVEVEKELAQAGIDWYKFRGNFQRVKYRGLVFQLDRLGLSKENRLRVQLLEQQRLTGRSRKRKVDDRQLRLGI